MRSMVRNTAFMDASRSGSFMATIIIQSFSRTILDPMEARLAKVASAMTNPEITVTDNSGLLNRSLNHSGMEKYAARRRQPKVTRVF